MYGLRQILISFGLIVLLGAVAVHVVREAGSGTFAPQSAAAAARRVESSGDRRRVDPRRIELIAEYLSDQGWASEGLSPEEVRRHVFRAMRDPEQREAAGRYVQARLREQQENSPEFDFDANGLQVGHALPALTLYDLDAKPVELASLAGGQPLVIISACITSPAARRELAQLPMIASAVEGKATLLILYTIESNPGGSPAPHFGMEVVPAANRDEGLVRAQPRTLGERIELALELQERLGVETPLLVDAMDNAGWTALGGGPNTAVVLDADGRVLLKQGHLRPWQLVRQLPTVLPQPR